MAQPGVPEIAKDLNLQTDEARRLRQALSDAEKDSDLVDEALDTANSLLEGHGVEAIRDEDAWDNYYGDAVALYVNMGDTYTTTVVYDIGLGEFMITDWGSWFEEYEKTKPKFYFIEYSLTEPDDTMTTYSALVRSESEEDALADFIDNAVKMGDDTVWDEWTQKFGDPKPEHSGDNVYYIVGRDPDSVTDEEAEDEYEEPEQDAVFLSIGKVTPFDRLDEAKAHERETGNLVMYESTN